MLNNVKENKENNFLKQPEKIYALFGASLLSAGIIYGFNLGVLAALGAIAVSAAIGFASIPVFSFIIQFARKLNLMLDHVDEVVVKAKSEMDELKVLKESLNTTVKEANETLSEFKKNTLPEGNKAISETSKAVKELQVLVDDISKKTLPAVNTVIGDVHGTMEFVNSGAQTASTLLSPVTGASNLLRKAGSMVGIGQSEKSVQPAVPKQDADPKPEPAAPTVIKQRATRQKAKPSTVTTRSKKQSVKDAGAKAPLIATSHQKAKKDQPTLKALAKKGTVQAPTETAAPGYLSYLKFW